MRKDYKTEPMKVKNYRPILFEIFQSDMEKYMAWLNDAIIALSQHNDSMSYVSMTRLQMLKHELQHKINMHMERKEWIL